uniref:Pre-mRNA-processing factor 6 n=1 Tax=Panagrolaimus sp. JU765 TaxID=591449 RepID=A0AC34QZ26_9BILA
MTTTIPGSLVNKTKKQFLGMPAPAGYVAGVGRGATGFTTRSDIGPARDTDLPSMAEAIASAAAAKKPKLDDDAAEDNTPETEDYNDSNFDAFEGYSERLFSKDPYDKEDEEADQVYHKVDMRMDERRRIQREEKYRKDVEKLRKEQPKIQQQFSDLKRKLALVSEEEWAAIPEVGDARNKEKRNPRAEKFTPTPDSLIMLNLSRSQNNTNMDPRIQSGMKTPMGSGLTSTIGGFSTSMAAAFAGIQTSMTPGTSTDIDLQRFGQARTALMGIKMDQASDSVSGQTVVDPRGYLTNLSSTVPQYGGDIADVKKAQALLKSVRETNPNHAPAWIAAASLEETIGKIQIARNIILEGCDKNPRSEDLWLEAVRLHPPDEAKKIVATAVSHRRDSVRIWLKAAQLELDKKAKQKVLRKALENVPKSVQLWKAAIELEDPDNARLLLTRAVECCPLSVELWLALAKLETYENAKKVLNQARVHNPADRHIWIYAARLEETRGEASKVEVMISRALSSLNANKVEINRKQWMEDAMDAEKAGCKLTAQSIIKNVMSIGVEEEDRKHTWLEDAEWFVNESAPECARAVYAFALNVFAKKKSIWRAAVLFEKKHGTVESYEDLLKKATELCPNAQDLWLMYAKSRWLNGDVVGARTILTNAFECNPDSEEIWLAAVKLESENGEHVRARKLLTKARSKAPSARVWMKSARLEWCLGDLNAAKELLQEGLKLYPTFAKFYMMLGQIYAQEKNFIDARTTYSEGTKKCSENIDVWIQFARLEDSQGQGTKARRVLDMAKVKNPKNEFLWLEHFRIELRAGQKQVAQNILARGLQECEKSGILWAEAIFMEPRHSRTTKSADALKKCGDSSHVLLAATKVLWSERKIKNARSWFKKTVNFSRDFGDAWAYYYKFETIHGTEEEKEAVKNQCIAAEPRYGEVWQSVAKDVKNWKKKTNEILEIVASKLEVPT